MKKFFYILFLLPIFLVACQKETIKYEEYSIDPKIEEKITDKTEKLIQENNSISLQTYKLDYFLINYKSGWQTNENYLNSQLQLTKSGSSAEVLFFEQKNTEKSEDYIDYVKKTLSKTVENYVLLTENSVEVADQEVKTIVYSGKLYGQKKIQAQSFLFYKDSVLIMVYTNDLENFNSEYYDYFELIKSVGFL